MDYFIIDSYPILPTGDLTNDDGFGHATVPGKILDVDSVNCLESCSSVYSRQGLDWLLNNPWVILPHLHNDPSIFLPERRVVWNIKHDKLEMKTKQKKKYR